MEPNPEDFSDLIEVVVEDGVVVGAYQDGIEIRVRVRNYDVEFPIDSAMVKRDDDGEYYKEMIV